MKKPINTLILSGQDTLILDALEEFLLALRAAHRSERTIEFYNENIRRFYWWSRKCDYPEHVNHIQAHHIRTFLQYLQTNNHRWASAAPQSNKAASDATVQAYFRTLRSLFNFCEREHFIEDNPFASHRIQPPKVKQRVMPSYSDGDVSELLKVCQSLDTGNSLRDTAIVYLLLDTGIRASELCGLQLGDLERGRLTVLGKGNKERYVIISPTTEKAVRDYVRRERGQSHDESLFLAKGGEALTRNGLYQMIERRAQQAGVANCGLHKFRHTFALSWVRSGAPLHALQTLLGHESPTMSLKYGRMQSGEQAAELHRKHSPVDRLSKEKKRK